MGKKIKKNHVQHDNPRVKKNEPKQPLGIAFSFKFLIDNNEKFSIKDKDARYLEALLNRLRDLSTMRVNEMRDNQSLRCHPIDWDKTTETCFGFPSEEQIVGTPYQLFQISSNEHGRVHGFFIENVAYIVWLDPDHNLYS